MSTNLKNKSYNLILIIPNYLIKIVYYKLIKNINNILDLKKFIFIIIVRDNTILDSIISNKDLNFNFTFYYLLYHILSIKY